jgi:O-acetyl-ADP-ribose deacetylase (regulator of RNase III)
MGRSRTYNFGASTLTLQFGDLTDSDAQVLVSSDDCYISMGGGVSAAIRKAGGEAIALDAAKKVPAALSGVVVSTAGALPAQYVFHAITMGANPENLGTGVILERTTRRCMQLLRELQLTSIAFPAIGAGVAGFEYEEVAAHMADVIADELLKREQAVTVTIFLLDRFGRMTEFDFLRFFEEFATRAPRVAKNVAGEVITQPSSSQTCLELAEGTAEEVKRRRLHYLRKLLGELEDQRHRLEEQLISSLGKASGTDYNLVRQALKENEELRFQYMTELRSFGEEKLSNTAAESSTRPPTIFVSSTYKDLVPHRSAVKEAIIRRDLFFRGMEHFGADPDRFPPAGKIVEEVRKADVYLGVFGVRYGSIDPATGLSMTELEFREAEASKKPMLLYIIHADAPVTVSHLETDLEAARKLNSLKNHILSTYVTYMFRNVDDLSRQVYEDLGKLSA